METNVTIWVFHDEEHEAACRATVAAFREKVGRLDIRTINLEAAKQLMAEGFTDLPVVKLAREGESWQGHQPDRIAAYQPALTEFHWDTRRARGPSLGVWRKWA